MSDTALPAPMPDPTPGEVARGLAALEAYLAEAAPAPITPVAETVAEDSPEAADASEISDATTETTTTETMGETRRVRAVLREVAEAERLLDLQANPAPLLVDTPRVRRRRIRAAEAARLYALDQDPAVLAYRDQRIRRISTVMAMTAAGIALTASSIGVQHSVARALELPENTAGWWAAFLVEPALSLPLLAAVAVQAYSAIRGRVVDRKSPEGKRLFRTEALLLGLTLLLNCWPALSGLLSGEVLPLLVHALGPVAAVTAVWTLPTLWAVLAALPMPPLTAPTPGLTAPEYRANAAADTPVAGAGVGRAVGALDAHRARLRELIASGELPPTPGADRIRRALGCGMDTARQLRDELAGGAA